MGAGRQKEEQAHALLRIQSDIGTPRAAVGVSQSTRLRARSKLALLVSGSRSTSSHRQTTFGGQCLTAPAGDRAATFGGECLTTLPADHATTLGGQRLTALGADRPTTLGAHCLSALADVRACCAASLPKRQARAAHKDSDGVWLPSYIERLALAPLESVAETTRARVGV